MQQIMQPKAIDIRSDDDGFFIGFLSEDSGPSSNRSGGDVQVLSSFERRATAMREIRYQGVQGRASIGSPLTGFLTGFYGSGTGWYRQGVAGRQCAASEGGISLLIVKELIPFDI